MVVLANISLGAQSLGADGETALIATLTQQLGLPADSTEFDSAFLEQSLSAPAAASIQLAADQDPPSILVAFTSSNVSLGDYPAYGSSPNSLFYALRSNMSRLFATGQFSSALRQSFHQHAVPAFYFCSLVNVSLFNHRLAHEGPPASSGRPSSAPIAAASAPPPSASLSYSNVVVLTAATLAVTALFLAAAIIYKVLKVYRRTRRTADNQPDDSSNNNNNNNSPSESVGHELRRRDDADSVAGNSITSFPSWFQRARSRDDQDAVSYKLDRNKMLLDFDRLRSATRISSLDSSEGTETLHEVGRSSLSLSPSLSLGTSVDKASLANETAATESSRPISSQEGEGDSDIGSRNRSLSGDYIHDQDRHF